MICSKCGSELKEGAKFCGKCGNRVVVERRCKNCNTLLEPDDIFCTECGTKYDDANTEVQAQKVTQAQKTESEKSEKSLPFAQKTESVCINTVKGKMAIIDDNIFFISLDENGNGAIYSVSLSNGGKATVVLNKDKILPAVFAKHIIQLNMYRLHAWKGKLYFSAEVFFDGEQKILDNIEYCNCIFSFCPETNTHKWLRVTSVDNSRDIQVFFCDNRAYYRVNMDDVDEGIGKRWIKELEAKFGKRKGLYYWKEDHYKGAEALANYDLETSQVSVSFMPMVAERDWKDSENGSGEIIKRWNDPIFYKGYIYTSIGRKGDRSLRFPVNNPEAYEFLPPGTVILNSRYDGIHLFAPSNDVIILPHSRKELIAISQSTLNPIDSFLAYKFDDGDSKIWQIYEGNYLVCGYNDAKIIDIKNAKYLGNTDWRYISDEDTIYDSVYYNNFTYTLGKVHGTCRDENGEEYYGRVLYRIPWDKMFKKDTKIDDFAQPLF